MDQIQVDEFNRRLDSIQGQRAEDQAAVRKSIDDLATIIVPMADAYKTAVQAGKWISGALIFLSVLLGVILGIKQIFRK